MMQGGRGIFFQLGVRSYKLGVGSCSVVALRHCEESLPRAKRGGSSPEVGVLVFSWEFYQKKSLPLPPFLNP